MRLTLFFTVILIIVTLSSTKVYTRCGLSQELARRNFPRTFLSNWVCMIESESGKDTSKLVSKANGSKSYGLFQINSKEWCGIGKVGGKCSVNCENLLNEDITDDITCARKIFNEKGFQAWNGWSRSCYQRKNYDVLKTCNL